MNYHKKPKNKDEMKELLLKGFEQVRGYYQDKENKIECICGRKILIELSYKCYFCGLWLCEKCAEKHFGKRPEGLLKHMTKNGKIW